jgi:hypothetical protein
MQPSKGLHNQVVKIVVPYCTIMASSPSPFIISSLLVAALKQKSHLYIPRKGIAYKSTSAGVTAAASWSEWTFGTCESGCATRRKVQMNINLQV